MKVILNVDDYGYTKSQIDGTIYAYQNGVVTSTTCLANSRDELMEYAAFQAKENPGLGIGCHLVLTLGECLTKGKTICEPDGTFKHVSLAELESMDPNEVYLEFKAQIERFIKYFGKKPTHLDSHHYDYGLMNGNFMRSILQRLTEEYGLNQGRGFNPDVLYVGELYNEFTYENFTNMLLAKLANGTLCVEQACHACFVDQEMYEKSSYTYQRIQELKVVTSEQIKQFYKEHNIEKVHY